ncbi:MAG TPA: SAM-dependent methyltransferase, partial [Bdellovibrionales bacterium]|nr:SAM-dependent methyltransferase [Bdellovibrionales bacterium]
MALRLVATSIGDPGDLSQRAVDTLKAAEIVIGEERKEASKLLKSLGLEGKRIELLNEHTPDSEVAELAKLCHEHEIALITDCGTPGFCDPGARLVAACRSVGVSSSPIPGASSLMCLLSVSGRSMNQFLFRGF